MIPLLDPTHPQPPDELITACATGECVLFAGAGLGARAGLPTWRPLVAQLLDWAGGRGLLDASALHAATASLKEGFVNSVVDVIVANLANEPSILHDQLRRIFLSTTTLSDAHHLLHTIPFSGAVTTNFDRLLEQTFADRHPSVYVPSDTGPLQDALAKQLFFILKLFGDLDQPASLAISPVQFQDTIADNSLFASLMETLFFSRTLFFVGASFEGIDDYLQGIRLRRQSGQRSHYALVGVRDDSWRVRADQLERRYGIQVIPYLLTPDHDGVMQVLSALAEALGQRPAMSEPTTTTRLKQVTLEQIGPFPQLELTLDPQWNILLGDNGVGKSSILRAIGLAICGIDPQGAAVRLMRRGQTRASVTLTTERSTYHADLSMQTPERADIRSIPARPLEAERWLVMGFPPLRTGSWERPRAPEPFTGSLPSIEDVLPLVSGTIDPRLDRLKQWIVNLDYLSKDERARSGTGGRYERLLQHFFEVIGTLAEGLTIQRGTVDPRTYEVTVITDDGELPIESVSQGMTSLIGWVGILLQRLYEVYDDADDPTQHYALVLIDEIDAHLHPAWQRTLVSKLSTIFPNAQFIATTHSPLIVAGMPPHQIVRFARDEVGHVIRLEITPEMTMGRADQILRSDLFGLPTALGTTAEATLARYQELVGRPARSANEEAEFRRLEVQLPEQLRLLDNNRGLLQAQALLLEHLGMQLKEETPSGSEALLESAHHVRSNLERSVVE